MEYGLCWGITGWRGRDLGCGCRHSCHQAEEKGRRGDMARWIREGWCELGVGGMGRRIVAMGK